MAAVPVTAEAPTDRGRRANLMVRQIMDPA